MTDEVFEDYASDANNDELNEGRAAFDDSVDRGKEVTCPNCGGNMVFDPKTQSLKCEHCGTIENFERSDDVSEIVIEKAFDNAEKWDKTIVVRCENCGAKVVMSADEVATECPYCGTSQIKRVEEIAGIKPNAVHPFTISGERAEQCAKKWAKSKIFAPYKFKKTIEAKNVHGVFEPAFTFDSFTHSRYSGTVGYTRTRTVGSGKNRRTETYTEWRRVSGTIDNFFDDVTVSASRNVDQKRFAKILPFPSEGIRVYEKKFLAGYKANHYDKDIRTCWSEAKTMMDARIRRLIVERYNADKIGTLDVYTDHSKVTYKYVLYPIYRFNYNYKSKDYGVAVNGQTGAVVGKTPISPVRVLIAVVLGVAALIGLYFLFNGS